MQEIKYPRQDPKTGKMRGEYNSWSNMINRINLSEGVVKKKENKVYADKKLELYPNAHKESLFLQVEDEFVAKQDN